MHACRHKRAHFPARARCVPCAFPGRAEHSQSKHTCGLAPSPEQANHFQTHCEADVNIGGVSSDVAMAMAQSMNPGMVQPGASSSSGSTAAPPGAPPLPVPVPVPVMIEPAAAAVPAAAVAANAGTAAAEAGRGAGEAKAHSLAPVEQPAAQSGGGGSSRGGITKRRKPYQLNGRTVPSISITFPVSYTHCLLKRVFTHTHTLTTHTHPYVQVMLTEEEKSIYELTLSAHGHGALTTALPAIPAPAPKKEKVGKAQHKTQADARSAGEAADGGQVSPVFNFTCHAVGNDLEVRHWSTLWTREHLEHRLLQPLGGLSLSISADQVLATLHFDGAPLHLSSTCACAAVFGS